MTPTHPMPARDRRERWLGKRDGLRWAITWLHRRADSMNDPQARAILNSAAFALGGEIRQGCLPYIPYYGETPAQDTPPASPARTE